MGKDPALLWYPNDWTGGTGTFSRHLKGCYMDLLMAQFNGGHLSLEEIKTVLGADFGSWPALQKKFITDSNGNFFNERLELEKQKRIAFTNSRQNNLKPHKSPHVKTHMADHMENRNRNENVIEKGKEVQEENQGAGPRSASGFEESWAWAFDELTIDLFIMHFHEIDVKEQLKLFRLKCDNDKKNYHSRDPGSLRTTFQYHLEYSKKKYDTNSNGTRKTCTQILTGNEYKSAF